MSEITDKMAKFLTIASKPFGHRAEGRYEKTTACALTKRKLVEHRYIQGRSKWFITDDGRIELSKWLDKP